MTYDELKEKVALILPEASIDGDFDTQIIIYTNLSELEDSNGELFTMDMVN